MKKSGIYILYTCTLTLLAFSCNRQSPRPAAETGPANSMEVHGSVHELTLTPDPPPDFPEHEGKGEFTSNCAVCHSLKYISGQPNFPAKTWEAEVNKMIAKYHAPIDSANAKKITAYLVAVKGK